MAAEKAWHKAFTSGSKALQDRLRKVHAKNPEFQSFLGKHGFEGGSSVKQASKAQTVSKEVAAKRTELSDKAYGATTGAKVGGDHVELKDTIAPLTKDQHSKVQVAKKAALSKDERIAAIARASRKASNKYDVPTEERDDAGYEDMRDLHHSLHIGHGSSLDEEAQKHRIEVTMSNPNHPAVTKRDERFSRVVRVTASNPEKALHAGWDHYKKRGYRVHEAEHIGMIEEQVDQLDEATKRAINITPEDLEVIKSGDHETVKKHMAKLVARAADTKLNKRPLRSDKANEFLSNIHSSTNVGQLQKMAYNMYLGGDDAGKSKYGSLHVYNPQSKMGRSYQRRYGISEASMKGVPYTPEEKDRMLKFERKDLHNAVIDAEDHGTQEEVGKARAALLQHQKDYPHISITSPYSGVTPRVDEAYPSPLDEPKQVEAREKLKDVLADIKKANPNHPAVAGFKEVMHKGEKITIPAHKAPKSGFNKFGKFATLDKVPVKEEKVEEAHIDPNFVATFGVAAAAYDHVLNPLLKKAKQKIADKMADKLAKKKEAPAEQVAEASLAADIQKDVDARNKRLADAAAKAKKKKAAEAKAASAAKQAKEMDKLKNLSKYGSDEEKEYAKGELQRIKGLEEANFKYDVDHMPGQTVRGTLPTSCPTCYGRKSMYVTPKGEMYADKKTEDSKRVACPDCQGKGYVAEESNEDSNYLNNKKNQIRESIQSKLAAKMGKK